MLVPFVIDADSLGPDKAWTPAQQRACYGGVLDVWQRFGLLAHDGPLRDDSRLVKAVMGLPQKVRPLWQAWMARTPLLSIPGWNGTVANAELADFGSVARLALVDDTTAEAEFGLDEEQDESTINVDGFAVSICRLMAAARAASFTAAGTLAGSHIEVGHTFQVTWDQRFKVLAQAEIKRVSVVDRYAIQKHHEPNDTTGLSGLERFLRLLNRDASGPRDVFIYSAWTEQVLGKNIGDIETDIRLVATRLHGGRIRRIRVCMAPNAAFRDGAHDRFIRFDHYVWDVGCGMDIFDGPFCATRSAASFKAGTVINEYRGIESELDSAGSAKAFELAP